MLVPLAKGTGQYMQLEYRDKPVRTDLGIITYVGTYLLVPI
jgi:hypothetical protein